MRFVLVLILLALPGHAFAQDWGRYENGRFGYAISVPPGFSARGPAASGDGQVFQSIDGTQTLTIWGNTVSAPDFLTELSGRVARAEAEGWGITYRAEAPNWATFSGTRHGRILYARAVAVCGGTQTANFTLEYSQADLQDVDAWLGQLAASLTGGRNC